MAKSDLIKVLLVEDHYFFRSGLKTDLTQNSQFRIIGEVDNGEDALNLIKSEAPDVILMDISLKRTDGIDLSKMILEKNPDIKIIILSSYNDLHNIKRAINAGAKGFLSKEISSDELLNAIQNVINDKMYFDPSISNSFILQYAMETQNNLPLIDNFFSPTEKEVFLSLMSGAGIKEMAGRMNVSVSYLSKVRSAIFEKAGVNSLVELTKFAIKEGFLPTLK